MKSKCPVCSNSAEGVLSKAGDQGKTFAFSCEGCPSGGLTMWSKLYPPSETDDKFMEEQRYSKRVLVKIQHSDSFHFARYSYKTDKWYVDGCIGDIVVLAWWSLPEGPGYQLG